MKKNILKLDLLAPAHNPKPKKQRKIQKKYEKNQQKNQQCNLLMGLTMQTKKTEKKIKKRKNNQTKVDNLLILMSFYSTKKYQNFQHFKNILVPFSNILANAQTIQGYDKDLQKIYRQNLKQILINVYKQILQANNNKYQFKLLKACWHLLYAFCIQIFLDKKIKMLSFSLKSLKYQIQFRKLALKISLNNLIFFHSKDEIIRKIINNKYNYKQILKKNYLQHLRNQQILQLSQIVIKNSFIYQKQQFKIIKQTLNQILNSKALSVIFNFYFKKLNESHEKINQQIYFDSQIILNTMKNLKIFFIDYIYSDVHGITYHDDRISQQFPIFINMHSFKQLQLQKYFCQKIKMYITITLIHQLSHHIIRKLQIIDNQFEQSNKYKIQHEDGGFLFERFMFGGLVKQLYYENYQQIQKLLNFNENDIDNSTLQLWFKQIIEQKMAYDKKMKKLVGLPQQITFKNYKKQDIQQNENQIFKQEQKQLDKQAHVISKFSDTDQIKQKIQQQLNFCNANLQLIQKFKTKYKSQYNLQFLRKNQIKNESQIIIDSNYIYTIPSVSKLQCKAIIQEVHKIGKMNKSNQTQKGQQNIKSKVYVSLRKSCKSDLHYLQQSNPSITFIKSGNHGYPKVYI